MVVVARKEKAPLEDIGFGLPTVIVLIEVTFNLVLAQAFSRRASKRLQSEGLDRTFGQLGAVPGSEDS